MEQYRWHGHLQAHRCRSGRDLRAAERERVVEPDSPEGEPWCQRERIRARANLIANGDFECPPITSSYQTISPGRTFCGWQVKDQSIDIVGGRWAAADGKQSIDLNGSPGAGVIEQFMTTEPGKSYRIRFALAGNFEGSPAVKTVSIFWDGKEIGKETFDTTGRTSTAMGWVYKEYTVKATATATPLAFSSLTEGSFGPVIDAVSVVFVGSAAAPRPLDVGIDWSAAGHRFVGAVPVAMFIERRRPATPRNRL
ncbi:MAG: choice-of-anchor C family protein [Thermomicrobiales bacterium]